ncbi:MAG TPA: class I SAM-dependent methyltransferase [Nocardioidaceae bacterium]|jgi:SAM-dependent methyltransferase|nr:class I SAM-dependent methyltransferase [Nocardioidaceae bacterium]
MTSGDERVPVGTRSHHDYWDSFYAGRESGAVPGEPSAFARWVAERLRPGQPVVELGFGTARDSMWFAAQGHPVSGYDFAESAVQRAQGRADGREVAASFSVLDLYDDDAVDVVAKDVGSTTDRPAVYGRFLIHSLEAPGRTNLFRLAARVLGEGGELYLEFRTGQDRDAPHLFGEDHYRVYLDPDVVAEEIRAGGGTITESLAGHGFAVYQSEDPHVARLVATFTG